jgi:hypothetical protein
VLLSKGKGKLVAEWRSSAESRSASVLGRLRKFGLPSLRHRSLAHAFPYSADAVAAEYGKLYDAAHELRAKMELSRLKMVDPRCVSSRPLRAALAAAHLPPPRPPRPPRPRVIVHIFVI